jgi:hypothetical protein
MVSFMNFITGRALSWKMAVWLLIWSEDENRGICKDTRKWSKNLGERINCSALCCSPSGSLIRKLVFRIRISCSDLGMPTAEFELWDSGQCDSKILSHTPRQLPLLHPDICSYHYVFVAAEFFDKLDRSESRLRCEWAGGGHIYIWLGMLLEEAFEVDPS